MRIPTSSVVPMAAAALAAAGCAAGFGAPGPGAAGVVRVNGPGVYVDPTCVGWCPAVYRDGYVRRDGPGLKAAVGVRLGVVDGWFAARPATVGPAGEPHVDVTWVPRSDRWAMTATVGYLFQSLAYDDATIAYRGVTPSATFHWGVRRRLSVHAGLGHAFGTVAVTPDGADAATTAGAGQHRALVGATVVFRRTPTIDVALRLEASAFTTGEVAIGAERGGVHGWGVSVEGVVSRF